MHVAKVKRRTAVINLRASMEQRSVIDRAAEVLGKSRSDFMLDAANRAAKATLLDQRYFQLGEKEFKKFTEALDQYPTDNPKLRELLNAKAPWEKNASRR